MDQPPPNEGAPQLVRPQVVPEYAAAPPRRRLGFFARLMLLLLVLGFIGSLGLNVLLGIAVGLTGAGAYDSGNRVREKHFSHKETAADKVAILSIEGLITSGEGFFKNQIDHALKDAKEGQGHLKAVVVRVNSPGGSISGSDYMLHHLKRLATEARIPVVVSMGGLAASGGYYVSMCVGDAPDTIFAEPTTWTGSIGVIIPHYDIADLMKNWGIEEDSVVSHHLKEMGSFAHKMTEEERKLFQELVDAGFTRFKDVIKQGRPKFQQDPAALDQLATGQIFTANQALESGLVDRIGFVEDAVDRAIGLARLDKDNVNVVTYKAEQRLSDLLFGSDGQTHGVADLAALFELATPRAYYLCSWLPSAIGSGKL